MAKTHTSTTLRIEQGFYDALRIAMIQRQVPTLQELVTRLLQRWLDEGSGVIPGEGNEEGTGEVTRLKEGVVGQSVGVHTVNTASEDWRLAMASEVLHAEHPVAPIALEANIISFWLQVREFANAQTAETETVPAPQRTREEIEQSIKRIRTFIQGVDKKHQGPRKVMSGKRPA
jgi:hypothetical protein